jgi:L-lactate dehydrogenase complex protein LldG
MSSARNEILARLDTARPPAVAQPPPMTPPPPPTDPIGTLRDRVEQAGGLFQIAPRGDWLNQIVWPTDLSATDHLYSSLSVLPSKGVGLDARSDRDLECLDLCILQAEFAVIENGAVWHVPSTPRERVAALLATHLILVVEATKLVPTLHQAYARIDLGVETFGWFLCGPSKTADIEQALVLGAHGPRTMSLVLTRD